MNQRGREEREKKGRERKTEKNGGTYVK